MNLVSALGLALSAISLAAPPDRSYDHTRRPAPARAGATNKVSKRKAKRTARQRAAKRARKTTRRQGS